MIEGHTILTLFELAAEIPAYRAIILIIETHFFNAIGNWSHGHQVRLIDEGDIAGHQVRAIDEGDKEREQNEVV